MKKYVISIVTFLLLLTGCQKNSIMTITDYEGNIITDYQKNTAPFLITSPESITVDGKPYKEGTRLYQAGTYTIQSGGETKKVTIKDPEQKNEYRFYFTDATLSTLYAALEFAQTNHFQYIWYGRADTLDAEYLKSIPNTMVSDHIGKKREDAIIEATEKMKEILREDANAHFELYINENNYEIEYQTLAALGLGDHRYQVYYISDGTLSYTQHYSIEEEQGMENFTEESENIRLLLDQIRSGEKTLIRHSRDFILPSALRENVGYYLAYPNLLPVRDEQVREVLSQGHFRAVNPGDLFIELTQSQKDHFFRIIGLDKNQFDRDYFSKSDKPYLILTGNNPMDYHYGREGFRNMIEQVVTTYQDRYHILFKPHPAALPDENDTAYFETLGIDILPGKMPMEAISFIYSDLKLGGFSGSLYLSASASQVLFFFAKDRNDMFPPLGDLCQSVFTDVIFIQPND